MYEKAEEKLNEGLSPVARWLLGAVAALFGVISIASADSSDAPFLLVLFGAFCILIAAACVTAGRVRQFIGSTIGLALFALALVYVYSQLSGAPLVSSRRSQPSLLNSLLFTLFFGLPGLRYALKARFGFRE